ncbi:MULTISPECIES: oligosaccharide flippase family protein [Vibrio]|uniref:oligosaccharide flippase family protein n=1 Tax=Vibrio TaxID=662 RepID=UPI0023EF5549|nr:oligosaccharide flippase family protein [Vibrio sp. F12]
MHHRVFRNSVYLTGLQMINVLGPLLVIPYLATTLAPSKFGELMMGLSWIAIGLVLTDFGFNLSAVKSLSEKIDNDNFVCEFVSAILIIKLIIVFLVTLLAYTVNSYFKWFSNDSFPLMLFALISQSFYFNWFFHAKELMKYITLIMGLSKLLYVALVLFFVNDPENLPIVYVALGVANTISLVLAIRYYYKLGYKFKPVNRVLLSDTLIDSSQYFLSRFMVALYTSASTFLVGAFGGAIQAGYYGIGEKFLRAIQAFTNSFAQALFPHMVKNNESKLLGLGTLALVGVLSLPLMTLFFYFEDIALLLFGEQYLASADIIMIFLGVALINSVSVCYGYPAFASIGHVKHANFSVVYGGVIQLILLLGLSYLGQVTAVNVAVAVFIVEFFVMSYRLVWYFRLKQRSEFAIEKNY